MLTPLFSIDQDTQRLIITIHAKYANLAETEIEYGEREFLFSSSPYFLRLHLPAQVIDDDTGTAKFDSDKGTFTVTVPKFKKGETFEGLDLISQLLRPQNGEPSGKRMVEEEGGEGDEQVEDEDEEEDVEGNEFLVDQEVPSKEDEREEEAVDDDCAEYGYGFAWRRRAVLGRMKDEIGKLIELDDAENTRIDERKEECARRDRGAFNSEHYLADTFDAEDSLEMIMDWEMTEEATAMTDEDRARLKDMTHRKLPSLSESETHSVSRCLIDMLFAFCYDLRTTMGERTVESSWTFARLSPSLTSLLRYESATEAVHTAARRALCYPLYRCWDLVERVFDDVKILLTRDRSHIVHVLCTMHSEFVSGGEFRYLLNELVLNDMLVWVQAAPQHVMDTLRKEVEGVKLERHVVSEALNQDLEMLETEIRMQMMKVEEEREDSDDDE